MQVALSAAARAALCGARCAGSHASSRGAREAANRALVLEELLRSLLVVMPAQGMHSVLSCAGRRYASSFHVQWHLRQESRLLDGRD